MARDHTPNRITIQCRECDTFTRVYRAEPHMKIGAFRYCPVCGSGTVYVSQSVSTDHWESLARSYNISVPLCKAIYACWEPQKVSHFGTFIRKLPIEAWKAALDFIEAEQDVDVDDDTTAA
jgi:hypothetical protein